MSKYSDFAAAIFDVDCTLLDDQPPGEEMGLHEQSRLAAARLVGKRHGITGLENITPRQCRQAFEESKVHVVFGVVWQMLVIAGVVSDQQQVDFDHPLVKEIVDLKEELHEEILRTKGQEIEGASAFVRLLAGNGFAGKLAIASTANRRDIDISFEITGLGEFFPDDKIISRQVFTHAKPHPEAFNLAFAALGLPETSRSKVIAFEDDPRGVMSAKAAGLYTCAITTRHKKEGLAKMAVPPDLIADSYAEFAELLGLPAKLEA